MFVLGTANRKKGVELADLFQSVGVELRTLADFCDWKPVAEDGDTFAVNARLKAAGYAHQLRHWVLADDSGLLVDVLNGEPGVRSADTPVRTATMRRTIGSCWSGWATRRSTNAPHGSFATSRLPIRREPSERKVTRRAVAAFCSSHECANGFGYDPLFEIVEYHRSFAELGLPVKSCLSHRARAAHRLVPQLIRLADAGAIDGDG